MKKFSVSVMVIGLLLRDFFLQQYTSMVREGSTGTNGLALNAEGNLLVSHILVFVVLIGLILYLRSRNS